MKNIGNIEFPEYKLSNRVRELREKRRWSQLELAEKTNLSQSTISQLEREEKDPTLSTLQKVAEALDVPLAFLFATQDVHVFDFKRLQKYNDSDELSPYLYMALGKVVKYARQIGFIES